MNHILRTILSLSVSGSILALVLFAGKPFLKNRISKAFSYYIWLLVLLRLVVPFAAPVNVMDAVFHFEQSRVSNVLPEQTGTSVKSSTDQATGPSAAASDTQTKSSQEQQTDEAAGAQTSAETQQTFSLWRFIQGNLFWLWLAGAVIRFGWFSVAYAVFSRRIRRSCAAPHDDDLAVFEQLRGRMRVRLFCSSYITTPMCIGFLRPVIVLPQIACVRSGMERELKDILRHELTHCRRKDVLYKWSVLSVTSLHWFNPLMLWIRRETGRACELSCDEAVVRGMSEGERQRYGNTLLTFSAGGKLPAGILATTLCEGKEQLKERLITIKHYKKKSTWAVVLTLLLALLLAGCAATLGVADSSDTGSEGAEAAAENSALRAALSQNTNDIADPFQSVAGELRETCDFPVVLPTYFPSPNEGNEWKLYPDIENHTFSIEIDQQQAGDTEEAHPMANWYGVITGNIGEPSAQPLEEPFENGDIEANDISLTDGIGGKEYIDIPDAAGGTAITWENGNWSFFVTAYPEGSSSSTTDCANQIIQAVTDSGELLPGLKGKFYFIYTGNMPLTEIYWEVESGIWYEFETKNTDFDEIIKILNSFIAVDGGGYHSDAAVSVQTNVNADGYTLAAAIPISDDIDPYEAPEVETTELDSSDIASVIVSYVCGDGTEILFYRARNGSIYCAFKTDNGDIVRFYEAGLYEDGYDIQPYEDVFGHNGFYIQAPVGAAYTAMDYYYFDADGTLKLLVQCDNYVIENDMNGDGKKELLSFYHGYPNDAAGAGMAFYCFERDGRIYVTTLDDLLMNEFPDIDFPGHYFTSSDDGSVLLFTYHLSGEETDSYEFELKFTEDSLMVEQAAADREATKQET